MLKAKDGCQTSTASGLLMCHALPIRQPYACGIVVKLGRAPNTHPPVSSLSTSSLKHVDRPEEATVATFAAKAADRLTGEYPNKCADIQEIDIAVLVDIRFYLKDAIGKHRNERHDIEKVNGPITVDITQQDWRFGQCNADRFQQNATTDCGAGSHSNLGAGGQQNFVLS